MLEGAGEQSGVTSTEDTGTVVSRDCKPRTHVGHRCFVTLGRLSNPSAEKTQ